MKQEPLQPEEILLFRNRVIAIGIVMALLFSLLASRLWYLQVLHGQEYRDFSKGNRIRLIPQAAPRGVIYDRNGIALADNRPAYQLQLIREDTPDLEKTLRNLSEALQIPYASLQKKVEGKRSQAPFKPIILETDLDYRKTTLVETYQEDFPGVSIVVESRRLYPYHKLASHILGYVGIRNKEQEEKLPANKRSSGIIIGRSGIELIKNDVLVGSDGGKQIEVDHVGRELRVLNRPVNPIPGEDVYLTLDIGIQQTINDVMKGKTGAVVVMNPKTGEILGMESFPGFNANLFAAGITQRSWNRLVNNPDHPLENKAIQGGYPPGSIFKLVTAYAGLDLKIINEHTTFTCNGYYFIKERKLPYKCWKWKQGGHGTVNLKDSIKGSCNVYFYHVGQEVGIDRLHDYALHFGLGKKTGIRLLHEKTGVIPSKSWKLKARGERWFLGETPPVAIGQGALITTPFQLINLVNIIANDGVWVHPHIIMDETERPVPKPLGLSLEYLKLIREGMRAAVNERNGTAGIARFNIFDVAAKTATSQVVGHKRLESMEEDSELPESFQNHAWFVAFAPVENPEISVMVLVEHGGGGASGAGPIARQIIDYYIKNIYAPQKTSSTREPSLPFSEQLKVSFSSQNMP